jgi:hypothetical protein
MLKKFIVYFLFTLVFIIASLFFFADLFINQNMINYPSNSNNKNIIFFSGHVFGKNIFGKITKSNIFQTKFMDVGNALLYPPQIITSSKDQWTFLIHKDSVCLYSKSKDKIYRFPVLDGNIISGCVSVLNNKNKYNLLLLVSKNKSKYGDDLIVSTIEGDNKGIYFKTILKKLLLKLNPWKIQTGDVDGDGKYEISIGMYKTSPLNPVMAKRPFIYQWVYNDIAPKWLGSRLSRPFQDYIFSDINNDGRDELISIEVLRNNHKIISVYTWKGFGFELIGNSPEYQDVIELSKVDDEIGVKGSVMAKVKLHNRIISYTLQFRNGMLVAKDNK